MVSVAQLIGLAAACVLLIVVPGPSVLFIVGRALSYGPRTALASAVGNSAGCCVAAAAIAIGLGPLLARSDVLFHVIKWIGAAYLVWLGVQAFRHARAAPRTEGVVTPPRQPAWHSIRAGLLVGVTNPKSFILFAAIVPQFLDRNAGHLPAQMLLLAGVPILIGLITDSGWALAAGRARDWLAHSPTRMTVISRLGGLSMIGLGFSVAATGRHD